MTKSKAKKLIVQIEESISEVEKKEMTQEEFEEYCDSAYTLITYLRILPNRAGR